jgi:hypothetical protein
MIYLLPAIGLPPGGSSTVHRTTQKNNTWNNTKKYIEQHKKQYIEQHKKYIEQHKNRYIEQHKKYIEQHKTIHRTTQKIHRTTLKQYIEQHKKQYIEQHKNT